MVFSIVRQSDRLSWLLIWLWQRYIFVVVSSSWVYQRFTVNLGSICGKPLFKTFKFVQFLNITCSAGNASASSEAIFDWMTTRGRLCSTSICFSHFELTTLSFFISPSTTLAWTITWNLSASQSAKFKLKLIYK